MEVRPGYKRTDVGLLPEDWGVVRLGDCARFRTGPFGSALHKSDYTDDGVPVVNPMHIIAGRIEPTRSMTITEHAAAKLSEFRLRPGDIVMGRRGDMGRCALVLPGQAGWLCGTGSMIVRCDDAADPAFVQRVLSSPRAVSALESVSVGSTMVNLNQGTLSTLVIESPPAAEQRAIAEAFADADALLDGLDRLIAKKRDLKQGAMQQLLTGHTRLPGFGGVWEPKRVDEMGEVLAGKALAIGGPGDRRPYLRTKNVLDGRIDTGDVLQMPMTATEFERFRILPGDVLLNEGQALELVGRCAMYRNELAVSCAMQNQLLRFRSGTSAFPAFAEQCRAAIPPMSAPWNLYIHRHADNVRGSPWLPEVRRPEAVVARRRRRAGSDCRGPLRHGCRAGGTRGAAGEDAVVEAGDDAGAADREDSAGMRESQRVEWKEAWRDEFLRWICGFANAEGGRLHIGRNERGVVVGVPNAARLLTEIPNKVRDLLGIVVGVDLHEEGGKEWLEIVVEPHPNPVSYRGEYHVRTGARSRS